MSAGGRIRGVALLGRADLGQADEVDELAEAGQVAKCGGGGAVPGGGGVVPSG